VATDWVPGAIIGATGLAGTGITGWLAWLQRPAATTTAAIQRANVDSIREHHRWLVSNGRALVAEAHLGGWEDDRVGIDQRYLALRQWLSDTTRERYAADWIDPPDRDPDDMPHPTEAHIALLDDLDRLERLWQLV
jgi:hypothetical protein